MSGRLTAAFVKSVRHRTVSGPGDGPHGPPAAAPEHTLRALAALSRWMA